MQQSSNIPLHPKRVATLWNVYVKVMFQFDLPNVILKKRLEKFETALFNTTELLVLPSQWTKMNIPMYAYGYI